jgi:hypothetical protein
VHTLGQSAVVVMNLVVIANMAPSFRRSFTRPFLPARNSYYVLAVVHAGLGTHCRIVGLYILVAAGPTSRRNGFDLPVISLDDGPRLVVAGSLLGVATYIRYTAPLLSQ